MANMTKPAYDNSIQSILPPMLLPTHHSEEKRVTQIPAAAKATTDSAGWETLQTRFGGVAFQTSQPIVFSKGLLGMPDKVHFGLANFPNPKFAQFKLLQSFDDHAVSFIGLPLGLQNNLIREEDIRRACEDLSISPEDVAMLLIVTVHRSATGIKLSVNLRAPLIIDAERRQGMQYVFPHDRYSVQHYLTSEQNAAS